MTPRRDTGSRRLRECAEAVQRGDIEAARQIAAGLGPAPRRSRPEKPKRRLVSLDPATDALLASTGNASAYVRALVTDAWSEWTEALAELRAAGWDRARILAASEDPAVWDEPASEGWSRALRTVGLERRRGNAALERAIERE